MTMLSMSPTAKKFMQPGDYDPQFKFLADDTGEKTGKVEFYAAVFGNVDLVGDVCMPGCFADSLKKWRESGNPIPVVFSHDWWNAEAIVGGADPNDCVEDGKGLLIRATFYKHDYAQLVYEQMMRKVVREASFAYDTVDEQHISTGPNKGANALKQLDIIEVGPCLKGANPQAGDPVMKALVLDMPGVTAKAYLEGSVEERQARINWAVADKFGDNAGTPGAVNPGSQWVNVVGTLPDRVVFTIFPGDGGEPKDYMADYSIDADGNVTLGDKSEVHLAEVIDDDGNDAGADDDEGTKAMEPDGTKKFAWTDADGNGHIPLDSEGQVRAALNLAQNDWTFRGNRMSPAPSSDDRPGVIRAILAAADKFNIETDLEAPKAADVADATSETGSGEGSKPSGPGNQYGGVIEPDYEDDEKAKRKGEAIVSDLVETLEKTIGTITVTMNDGATLQLGRIVIKSLPKGESVMDEDDVETKDEAEARRWADSVSRSEAAAKAASVAQDNYMKRAAFFRFIGDIDSELKMLELAAEARKFATDTLLPKGEVSAKSGNDGGAPGTPVDDEKDGLDDDDVETKDITGEGGKPGIGKPKPEQPNEDGLPATARHKDPQEAADNPPDIPPTKDAECSVCGGDGEDDDGEPCAACDGTGRVANTKDLDPGDGDDVDTDGDQSAEADAAEPAKPYAAQKSASATSDEVDGENAKDDEPAGAKSDERTKGDVQARAKADLADIDAFLANES